MLKKYGVQGDGFLWLVFMSMHIVSRYACDSGRSMNTQSNRSKGCRRGGASHGLNVFGGLRV